MINKIHVICHGGGNTELIMLDESSTAIKDGEIIPIRPSCIPELIKECQQLMQSEFYTILNDTEAQLLADDKYAEALTAFRERTGLGYKEGRNAYLAYCNLNGLDSKREKL